jgi:uncharacterized membrane protein
VRRSRVRRVGSSADAFGRHPVLVRTPWRGRFVGFGSAAVAALLVLFFAPPWISGTTRSVAAYDAATAVLIAVMWSIVMHSDAGNTACRAAVEDPGRNVVLVLVLGSVVFGLAAAIAILGREPHVTRLNEKLVIYAVGLFAVIAGWAVIHTIFVFRYAHLFYFDSDDDGSAQRGLIFPGTDTPNDYDFAYFSFVIGMTFQVSDVAIKDSGVRRVALLHALISFAYNTMIVALVINIVSGLFH